ncbi:asparagine synthase (glutamine-hydrolyzing) [Synechococcus sp. BIOS-E4-1]|uniref:asparagine synthase (glutamine-hydrolyzing) n=1 Tax=Synechococcus sp. BIOS-E4-1 TaxID=1400864 RepID=UPI001644980F|nr:asparagine synthase (glutamine-hydrolyzing) [Synechococcus sp. BIOS-E4-1]QNI52881.1 asparagine synthase (glutamine-hydrolyzing) [Synechococcus sp. BIOS-E4-1]
MCGLVGFLTQGIWSSEEETVPLLHRMTNRIVNRGPDSAGYWHDSDAGIALGHRRLSVVDLSPAGAQPMHSACGRYVMAFNGEIYNHLELRELLGNSLWRGHSDTETVLEAFSSWGIISTLQRCNGMYAIALWDKKERTLTLARDRIGEKPLYYGWQGQGANSCFLFGSELNALKAHPSFSTVINRDALSLYMRHNYIASPHSIYQGIHKLTPGCFLTISLSLQEPDEISYWSLPLVAQHGVTQPFTGSDDSAIDTLESLLKDSVRQQMVADVDLGAFLSGGIDSSTVVALMQAQSNRPVKTFTIGFSEDAYNEAIYAKAVAKHLGTEHTELYVTPQQALDVIPKLPNLYNEPFADSSQIPTFLVSQLASQYVTVSLSGDAGDELFCGYGRYMFTRSLWDRIRILPLPFRKILEAGITGLSPAHLNILLAPLKLFKSYSLRKGNLGDRLHKAAGLLASPSLNSLYLDLVTHWVPNDLVLGANEPLTYLSGNNLALSGLDSMQRMMALDTLSYLPDDILVKVDRAAMGVSLETRLPFLDQRVVEFAWQLPQDLKMRGGAGKWALRQVLNRYVPSELIDRPKMGFGVPLDDWLRGPLRDWAEDLLCESRMRQEGYLNPEPIQRKWAEHVSGTRNWHYHLWDVLMFQSWLRCHSS